MHDEPILPSLKQAPLSVLLTTSASCPDAADVVACWAEHIKKLERPFEILVVGPSGSADLEALAQSPLFTESQARLVTYDGSEGDGPALRAGLAAATHPVLVCAPCDKQYHPKDLDRLLSSLENVHVAVGYRVFQPVPDWLIVLDTMKRWLARIVLGLWLPARNYWLGWEGWRRRFTARWCFGLRLHDPECGLRVFRREIFAGFPIQSRGRFTLVEVLAKANHLGCYMTEDPVSWVPPGKPPADPNYAADARGVFRQPEFHPAQPAPAPTSGMPEAVV